MEVISMADLARWTNIRRAMARRSASGFSGKASARWVRASARVLRSRW
jgi:hypothetical protein